MEASLSMAISLLQTSVKMKLLCSQVAKDLLGDGIDVSSPPFSLSYPLVVKGGALVCSGPSLFV